MDEETKKFLEETYALNKQNNDMLKKLVLYQKWSQIYRIVYWSIIILSAIGFFYFLKPLLGNLVNVYTGGVGVTDISNLGKTLNNSQGQIQDLIKSLNN